MQIEDEEKAQYWFLLIFAFFVFICTIYLPEYLLLGDLMAATSELIQVTAMEEMVRHMGIELPATLPDYREKTKEAVNEAFGAEVDRLLGTDEEDYTEGVIESNGVVLSVASSLKEDVEEGDSNAWFTTRTSGPVRWLSLTAPFRIEGLKLEEELKEEITLRAGMGHCDSHEPSVGLSISGGLVIPTTPLLEAFRLGANETDHPYPNAQNMQSMLTDWGSRRNELKWHTDTTHPPFIRAFGIGIEVLRQVEPGMLTMVEK